MAQEENISDEQKAAQQAERERRREISLSPLKLLDAKFTEGLEDRTNIELGTDEVRARCFEVLHLIDQYHRPPQTKEELETVQHEFAAEDTATVDAYLEEDTSRQAEMTREGADSEDFPEQHQAIILQRIRAILKLPQVREKLFGELQKEAGYYESNKEILERLKKLRRAQLKATREMHSVYLDSKKRHKKITASAQERIKNLTKLERDAIQEEKSAIGRAQAENGPALGLITAQELLRYKRQMKERGFALTESRRKLLERITEHVMAGRKVFLVGSTGTGKTELAFYSANELTGDYELIPWHEGTTPRDILGQMQIRGGEGGVIESGFKPGPMPRAYTKGKGLIHEEITVGSTRAMMGMKPYLNLKPGGVMKIPEANGEVMRVEDVIEYFTGNPKDERTREREELDPAILRMLKGIHVQYMPAEEMAKIILANLIEESGVLELSKEEVEFIQHLADAASLMQQCHDNAIPPEAAEELKKATGLEDLRLTKNFLDPGTFFALFSKYDFEKARGRSFKDYMAEQLQEFVNDPKTLGAEEERKVLLAILKLKGVISETSTFDIIETQIPEASKNYLLPSELGFINAGEGALEEDEFASEEERRTAALVRELSNTINRFPSRSTSLPEDAKRWCETLLNDAEHGYEAAKDTVSIVLDSTKGEAPPNKKQVKAALLRTLTPDQIAELKKLREPTLLIIPDTTAERFVSSVDKPACKTMPEQADAYFHEFYTNALSAIATQNGIPEDQPKITKYRFVITEGRQHFDAQTSDHDFAWNKRENMKNADRIAAFETYIQAHPGLLSQNAAMYLMLMIRGLRKGEPTDRISDTDWRFTLLPGEPKTEHVKDGLVAYGDWFGDSRRANFGHDRLELGSADARLRAAVMGEIS